LVRYPRIGNQTSYTSVNILEPFEFAITNRFDAFEWFPDKKEDGRGWSFKDIDNDTRRYIRSKAIENNIQMAIHVPWYVDLTVVEAHHFLDETIKFALDTKASLINIHLSTSDINGFVRSLRAFLEGAIGAGLNISIENTIYTGPEEFNNLFKIISSMREIDKNRIGMCLDVGHANIYNRYRNDYIGYVNAINPDVPIIHLHIHENFGDDDTHLTVFTGASSNDDSGIRELLRILYLRRFAGMIILEQWPEPRELLKDARDRLLRIWNEILVLKKEGRQDDHL